MVGEMARRELQRPLGSHGGPQERVEAMGNAVCDSSSFHHDLSDVSACHPRLTWFFHRFSSFLQASSSFVNAFFPCFPFDFWCFSWFSSPFRSF